MKNKIVCLAMITAIIIISLNTKAEVVNGTCSDDGCEWSYNTETKKLTITGNGSSTMDDYSQYFQDSPVPWNAYRQEIESLSVNGLKSLGERAFQYHTALKEVSLSNELETLVGHAFQFDTSLSSINIPDTVTSLEFCAFQGSGITDIIIPSSVTTIEQGVFADMDNLVSVIIPDSVTSIGRLAFLNTPNLTSIIIPDSVTEIANDAFENTVAYIYCKDTTERLCKDLIFASSGKLKIYTIDSDGKIKVGEKTYANLNDLPKYVKRRIYSIDEANAVAGTKNRVSITYR